jgi:HEAT repeat protein
VIEMQERERSVQEAFEQRFAFERERIDARLADVASKTADASTAAAGTLEALGALRGDVERVAGGDRKAADELAQRMRLVEEDLRFYSQRLTDLEMASLHPPAATPAATPAGPSWQAALPDLASDSASVRLEAVYALSEAGDPAIVEHLVPLLEDVDVFVRMATARVLGGMLARPAVPALIEALDDQDTAVREAAFMALKEITGRDFRYDPYASEGERAKRIKAWREWWEDEGKNQP